LIFAKLVLGGLFCAQLFAAGSSFSITGNGADDNITELKQKAIIEYLQAYLGARFESYAAQVTPEFAERYVQDYKVNRSSGKIQVTGHLDADGLKGWVRLSETKRGANTVKPVFLLSSSIPGLTLAPSQTAAKTREGGMGQVFLSETAVAFQKLNAKLGVGSGSISLNQPPRNDSELRKLEDFAKSDGFTSAVWVHLVPCKTCGGARLDTHFYNLNPARQVLARSDELPLGASEFANSARLKQALKGPVQALRADIEEKISNGALFSNAYRLTVQGLENYRAFKVLQSNITETDFIISATLKRSEHKMAEYEILSSLSAEEIGSRLDSESFDGFRLKTLSVDAPNVVVKFGR